MIHASSSNRIVQASPLENAHPEEILIWALEAGGPRLVQVSAFGAEDVVITHMLRQLGARVPVIFIDTLHHFPETLALVERLHGQWRLDLRVARTADVQTRPEFEQRFGARLWELDLERFHQVTKVKPLFDELEGGRATAWISGRRRDQAVTRELLRITEQDRRGLLKVNPLAAWSRQDVWDYIRLHHLPYNALYDRGYASIGDEPLTTPVADGEPERAGRWRGRNHHECGIHL